MSAENSAENLLSRLHYEEQREKRGRLKIFFGAAAGVGKTYSMLEAARKLKEANIDIVVGYAETHGRKETEALLEGLEILPPKIIEYKGVLLKEFDIDACLARKPEIILVDELAHTNAPGSRHVKRWQDVQELIDAGIDVYSTLNVQHVESLHDVIAQITHVSMSERVPDSLLEKAQEIELIDLPPDELLQRLKEGKVYLGDQAKSALQNFFRKGNLIALRELALRYTAERVVAEMQEYREAYKIKDLWPAAEQILVCVSANPMAVKLVRAGKRMSEALHAKWMVLYVEGINEVQLPQRIKNSVMQTLRLAQELGAQTIEASGQNVSAEIIKCANEHNISKIIIGKPERPRWREILFGSVVDDVIRQSGPTDVYVITGDETEPIRSSARKSLKRIEHYAYLKTALIIAFCTYLAGLMFPYFKQANLIMVYLLGTVVIATRYGRGPSIFAAITSVAAFDFFYVPPYYSFSVSDTQYLVTLFVMLFVALVISNLTIALKLQAEAAYNRERRTAALYAMVRELVSAKDVSTLAEIGLQHIATVFNCQTSIMLAGPNNKLSLISAGSNSGLANLRLGVADWVYQNKKAAGLGTDTIPGAKELYIPLVGSQKCIGVLAIKPVNESEFLSPGQLHLLEAFADQIALACERAQLL